MNRVSLSRLVRLTGPLALVLMFTPLCWAQTNGGGVEVDPQGVLILRETDVAKGLQKKRILARKQGKVDPAFAYISLPRLFKDVQAIVDRGETIPDEMKFLDGMVKLQYVFVYPEEKDLVIAGPREDWDATDPHRPLGLETGRAVLRLEDLVMAMRIAGPEHPGQPFGCSLDLAPNVQQRLADTARQIGAVYPGQNARVLQAMMDSAGPQQVRMFNMPDNSPFAFRVIEADYQMKRLALGLEKPSVRTFKSHLALMKRGETLISRWWFVADYPPLLTTDEGNAFEIRGHALKLRTSGSLFDDRAQTTESAKKYTEQFNRLFPEIAEHYPCFSDMWNLTDLSVLAALIGTDRLHEKTNWDVSWVLHGFPVREVELPTTAATLGNYKLTGGMMLMSIGGVNIAPRDAVAARNREVDTSASLASISPGASREHWVTRRPPPEVSEKGTDKPAPSQAEATSAQAEQGARGRRDKGDSENGSASDSNKADSPRRGSGLSLGSD